MTYTMTNETLNKMHSKAIEQFQATSSSMLNAIESVAALGLAAAKEGFEKAAHHGKAILEVKTPQEFAALTVDQVNPAAEKVSLYSKQMYDISVGATDELKEVLQAQFNEFQQMAKESTEAALKLAPFGSDVALAAFKQAEDAASKAYANFNNALNNAKAIAEENISKISKSAKTSARKAK